MKESLFFYTPLGMDENFLLYHDCFSHFWNSVLYLWLFRFKQCHSDNICENHKDHKDQRPIKKHILI